MNRSRREIRRYVVCCLAAVSIGWVFQVTSFVVNHDGLPLRMLRLGSHQAEIAGISRVNATGKVVILDGDGFDGQFFYFLGGDPLVRGGGAVLGAPHLRARRIGLAWIGLALGLGEDGRAVGLLVAQSLSLLALIALFQHLAFREEISPWLCVAIPLLLPVLMPLEFVTAELVAGALVIGALVTAANERPGRAAFLVGAACLCKEICVLVVAALMIEKIVLRQWRRVLAYSFSVVPLLAWIVYLGVVLPVASDPGDSLQNIDWPFAGLGLASLADFSDLLSGVEPQRAAGNLAARVWYFAVALVALPMSLRKQPTAARILLGFSALLALVLSAGGPAFAYDFIFNFARQLFLLPLAAVAVLFLEWKTLSGGERVGLQVWLWVGAALGLAWAVQQIFFP